ncbi:MAG: S1C family serine protease [Candidatus Doudnabacteria bacterium]|nr:S1C family serine protease [Candidatus Doudnabacteria bacterium]
MNKKQATFIILVSVILTLLVNIFFGRYLMAKISTWPVLNRLRLLSPQAPIVINNNQTVRVSDSGDAGQLVRQVNPKLATVVLVNNGSVTVAGAAANLTSDGGFVAATSSFGAKAPAGYFVVLSDGTEAPITQIALDPATSLAFFKADLSGVPVQNLDNSAEVAAGDKLFFIQNSLQNFTAKVAEGAAVSGQSDIEGQVFAADNPSRGFGIGSTAGLSAGEAVLDSSGNIVGIFNGSAIISADVLKKAMSLFFGNPAQIIRPSFGFNYSIVTRNDSRLTGLPQGAAVKSVAVTGPARTAGLEVGDIIISVDSQAVSEASTLEPLLENYQPGDTAAFVVARGKNQLTLKLKVGQLK